MVRTSIGMAVLAQTTTADPEVESVNPATHKDLSLHVVLEIAKDAQRSTEQRCKGTRDLEMTHPLGVTVA